MMQLILSPQRRDDTLAASVSGEVLTLNGTPWDLSEVTEGGTLDVPGCDWIAGPVRRVGGQIIVELIVPHGPDAPPETRSPDPVAVTTGTVDLPPHDAGEGA